MNKLEKGTKVKVRYIGESNPLMLLNSKEYEGIVSDRGWLIVVDETEEEYGYPPELFDLLEIIE